MSHYCYLRYQRYHCYYRYYCYCCFYLQYRPYCYVLLLSLRLPSISVIIVVALIMIRTIISSCSRSISTSRTSRLLCPWVRLTSAACGSLLLVLVGLIPRSKHGVAKGFLEEDGNEKDNYGVQGATMGGNYRTPMRFRRHR